MKTMKWLLRREFWENKGSMFWAPIVVGALMVLLVGVSALYGSVSENHISVTVDGQTTTAVTKFEGMPMEKRTQMAESVAAIYPGMAAPLYLLMAVVAFFYCLGALNEERRDRSILFWKSLPISDGQTVLSKVITAALVAPLITIAVGTFVSMLLLLIAGIALALQGVNMFALVLSSAEFYLAPLKVLGMLPVYVLWALPTIGWLLMVSAWAKSKVFLWAVGTPLISVIIVKWVNFTLGVGLNIDWFIHNIVARGLGGLIPGLWLAHIDRALLMNEHHSIAMSSIFAQSWMTLSGPSVWIGAIAGAAMIFVAIRLRRWKDEG